MPKQPEPDMFADQTSLVPVTPPIEPLPAVAAPPVVSGNTANILALIDAGMKGGQSAESIGHLVAILERTMAKDAETQFVEAKRAFQAECPVIGKNKQADLGAGKASYRYADLEKITQAIRPLLEKHGFSYDFAQTYDKEVVKVICYLRHRAGHVQATEFSGPWATNAGMSAIQKSASATTFCQRYALRLALGLPVGEDDDAPRRDEYPPPPQNADAPNPRTRSERQTQFVPRDKIAALYKEWIWAFNEGKNGWDMFVAWAIGKAEKKGLVSPPGVDVSKPDKWDQQLYDECVSFMPPKGDAQ